MLLLYTQVIVEEVTTNQYEPEVQEQEARNRRGSGERCFGGTR